MTATAQESATLIYAFPRGENEEVQFALTKYKGRFYIDLRLWFHNEGEEGFKPTKKGIAFSVDHLDELKEGVRQISDACSKVKTDSGFSQEPYSRSTPPQQTARRSSGNWVQRKTA